LGWFFNQHLATLGSLHLGS